MYTRVCHRSEDDWGRSLDPTPLPLAYYLQSIFNEERRETVVTMNLSRFLLIAATICNLTSAFIPNHSARSYPDVASFVGRSARFDGAFSSSAFCPASNTALKSTKEAAAVTARGADNEDSNVETITRPRGASNDWEVHKFGGASLATADLYRTVGDLLIKEASGRGDGSIPTMA